MEKFNYFAISRTNYENNATLCIKILLNTTTSIDKKGYFMMKQFAILLKTLNRDKNNGVTALFLINKKKYILTGNIPPVIPNGSSMKIEYTLYNDCNSQPTEKGYITDYEWINSNKNCDLVEKNGMDLEEFKSDYELHQKLRKVAWQDLSKVKSNPYKYFHFASADRYHKASVNNSTDRRRLEALCDEFIAVNRKRRKEECTLIDYLYILKNIQDKYSAYDCLTDIQSAQALNNNNRVDIKNGCIEDVEVKQAGLFINRNIKDRGLNPKPFLDKNAVEKRLDMVANHLSDEQRNVVVEALIDLKPVCITGGAGVGKTTTINEIINAYVGIMKEDDVLLLAPTGKASRRMANVCSHEAKTIHSALRKIADDEYTYFNANNPLPNGLIIVDESSMIDTLLMSDLLKAIMKDTKVIFVGDYNQLYPVGVGEPFHSFINQGLSKALFLTKNFRQNDDNDILANANAILDGSRDFIKAGQCVLVDYIKTADILQYVTDKVQIICPFNSVNAQINEHLKKGDRNFNLNDRVIFLKNTKHYCNGDTGVVVNIVGKEMLVKLDDVDTIVKVNHSECFDVALAYALTVHKVQGSEYADVILFLPKKRSNFIDNRMIYTAITRAKASISVYYYED